MYLTRYIGTGKDDLVSNLPVTSLHQFDRLGSQNDFDGTRYGASG
jgi:hypothetical protein